MGSVTAERLAEQALDVGLLTPSQLQDVWGALGTRSVSVDQFVQALIRRELLTKYQADRLLKGEKTAYFYGDYKVLYLVGRGTFARVFRAAHRETGEVVAIKALRSCYSQNPAQYGMFVREGELGRSLRHPNIVPIYEVHSSKKLHYFVMEFVEGRNLRDFVKVRKGLSPKEATRLMADIARGLDYAFQRSVTHRDLKMTNVLISSRGDAKLVDFGLAAIDENASTGVDGEASTARTVDYAALERATGVRRDDTRSDIYFAGCIYYHMLSGKPPLYEGRDRMQRLNKSRFGEVVPIYELMPSLPNYLASVVNKAMALKPARRYQTPGEMLADVEAALRRLESEAQAADQADVAAPPAESQPAIERRVMVVESNLDMQNLFREGLKKSGYRVLLTSDPERAFDRLIEEPGMADCILLNAERIGEPAVDWFNRLATHPATQDLPAILLLGEAQRPWTSKAQAARHRLVYSLPITMRQLRAAVELVLPD
jgi:serine/threonine-protein kinase